FGLNYSSLRETNYSLNIGGNNNLAAVIDINKNLNGLNLSFNANRPFDDSSSQNANVSLSKKF